MNPQELVDYMMNTKAWKIKESLFAEAFPRAEDRTAFFLDYANRLMREYEETGQCLDEIYDIHIRKFAIDRWYSQIPKSLLKDLPR